MYHTESQCNIIKSEHLYKSVRKIEISVFSLTIDIIDNLVEILFNTGKLIAQIYNLKELSLYYSYLVCKCNNSIVLYLKYPT